MVDRILVDANSVGHAAYQGTTLKAGDQHTQAVFSTIKAARLMRVRYSAASILFLWDGRSWRKDVSTEYKANRTDTTAKAKVREGYKAQAPLIRKALRLAGVPQLFALNLEADDLAGIMSRKFNAKGDFVRLVSGDRDWLQLVGPNCIWEDHRDAAKIVGHEGFEAKTGYKTAEQFVQSKALQGDTSDNLAGVGKIGEKGAADLLAVWGDVRAFLADADPAATWKSKREGKFPKAFSDFHTMKDRQDRFFLNMRLMDLRGDLPAPEKLTLVQGPCQPNALKLLCHELGFASLTANFDEWVHPFLKDNAHGPR